MAGSSPSPAWAEMAANIQAMDSKSGGGSPGAAGGTAHGGDDEWDLRQIQWPQHLADPSDSSSSSSGFLTAALGMPPSQLYSGAGDANGGKGKGNGFWNSIQDRWPAEIQKTPGQTGAASPARQGADGSRQISWPRHLCNLDDEQSAPPPPPPPALCSAATSTAPPSRDSREDASLLSISTDAGPGPTGKSGSKKCVVSL
mmetsp:Transcript_98771/g.205887  ORF Transcript_98771/g.205887 Transcript_98771/m.205887 type:complete len:200 (-) Transcript_98771:46-645(-)